MTTIKGFIFVVLKIKKGTKGAVYANYRILNKKNTLRFERIIQVLLVQVCSSYPYPSVQ